MTTQAYPTWLLSNIKKLLDAAGEVGACKGCGKTIWWIRHRTSGKPAPYTEEGLNHFADCPQRAQFKKP